MKRLVVIAYDGVNNPATRLRIAQFIPAMERDGIEVSCFYIPYSDGGPRSWTLRELLTAIRGSDVVFVQRTLFWWLVPLLRLAGRPFVFDVDDAIHFIRQSQYASALAPSTLRQHAIVAYRRFLRGGRYFSSRKRMFDRIIRHAAAVIVGNDNLAQYVGDRTKRLIVLATSVPVETMPVREHRESWPVRIGWIGVPSNLFHLQLLARVFRDLVSRFNDQIRLVIVSNKDAGGLPIGTEFVKWSLETESSSVLSFDIGIMPLTDDVFSRGKCSFKAIYCMAHGLPVVVSPVGMNSQLVQNGVNGFLADSDAEWMQTLCALIESAELRTQLGAAARSTIERDYSSASIYAQLKPILDALSHASPK